MRRVHDALRGGAPATVFELAEAADLSSLDALEAVSALAALGLAEPRRDGERRLYALRTFTARDEPRSRLSSLACGHEQHFSG